MEWRTRVGQLDLEVIEAVVICNGKHTEPKIAAFPGNNNICLFHAKKITRLMLPVK